MANPWWEIRVNRNAYEDPSTQSFKVLEKAVDAEKLVKLFSAQLLRAKKQIEVTWKMIIFCHVIVQRM